MPKKKTHEEFTDELNGKFKDEFIPLDKYINNSTKIRFFHSVCKQEFTRSPKQVLRGDGCKQCNGAIWDYEKVKHFVEVKSNSGCKLLSESYQNQYDELSFECKCGNKFYTKFREFKFSNKIHCDECGNRNRSLSQSYSFEHIKNQIENILDIGFVLISKQYRNNETKLDIQCPNGHIFQRTYSDFQQGNRCQCCTIWKSSKGEERIKQFLEEKSIPFIQQYTFEDCRHLNKLKYDFVVFNDDSRGQIKFIIEFDGMQHYEPVEHFGGIENFKRVKLRDEIKNDYCVEHNFDLLRIPYWDYDNIELILQNKINQ